MSESKTPTYRLSGIDSESTLDFLEKMLTIYSTYFILSGKGHKNLRPQLAKVLAIYVRYGYNKESREMATKVCGFKDSSRITCLNKELRDAGYLLRDKGNENINHLNEDLEKLRGGFERVDEAIPKLKEKGIESMKIAIELDIKFP